ncbi:MAG: hypothetical protein J0H01_28840 [Rhizobiales bacterium]|nr:hypothetical protein [Hyphomicrobiales bacterium]
MFDFSLSRGADDLSAVVPADRPAVRSAGDLARLIAARPADYALYFDVDGTLVDIAETPERVTVPTDLAGDLAGVRRQLGGAVAVVTGRRLADVERLLAPAEVVGSGMHGLEFQGLRSPGIEIRGIETKCIEIQNHEMRAPEALRPDEARHGVPQLAAPELDLLRADDEGPVVDSMEPRRQERPAAQLPQGLVDGVVRLAASIPGLRLEQKGPILTVHYRQIPTVGARVEAALTVLLADHGDGYHLKPGRAVAELIPDGTSKGTAIARIMTAKPFAGRCPIMIGDEHADEDAFAVARAAGGFGLAVAGEHFGAAGAAFHSAAHVRSWIADLHAGLAQ